jgi:hypothetical protein
MHYFGSRKLAVSQKKVFYSPEVCMVNIYFTEETVLEMKI